LIEINILEGEKGDVTRSDKNPDSESLPKSGVPVHCQAITS